MKEFKEELRKRRKNSEETNLCEKKEYNFI